MDGGFPSAEGELEEKKWGRGTHTENCQRSEFRVGMLFIAKILLNLLLPG